MKNDTCNGSSAGSGTAKGCTMRASGIPLVVRSSLVEGTCERVLRMYLSRSTYKGIILLQSERAKSDTNLGLQFPLSYATNGVFAGGGTAFPVLVRVSKTNGS